MKHLLSIVALALFGISQPATAQEPDGIRWMDSLTDATKLAAATGKPMFVVFR
jgi:hypothetical protein